MSEPTKEKKRMSEQHVITTEHRGVFAGEVVERDGTSVTVEGCRMAVTWSAECRGVLGLASHGPNDQCRISRKVGGSTVLHGVTGLFPMSADAFLAWEAEPWQS